MTPEQREEYNWLALATEDTHKFGLAIGYPVTLAQQEALERLQLRGWIQLIDVTTTAESLGSIVRVFKVAPTALMWYADQRAKLIHARERYDERILL